MKRTRKVFLGASTMALALAITAMQVHADGGNAQNQAIQETLGGDVPAVYDVAESLNYPVNLIAEGKGSLLIGDTEVKDSKFVYSLKADKSVIVQLRPSFGNSVSQVILNGKDITSSVKGDSVTVKGTDKEQTLKVRFTNKTLLNVSSNSLAGSKSVLPHTGERAGFYTWTGLLVACVSLLATVFLRRKSDEVKKDESIN